MTQPSGDLIPLGGFVHNWDGCDVAAGFKFAITELASYGDLFSTAFYIRQIGLRSVWRRYNGRRWIYKRVVDYKDPEDDNLDAVGPGKPPVQNTERRSLAEVAVEAPADHGR